jgi:hypothetical protein
MGCPRGVCFAPDSDRTADIAGGRFCANGLMHPIKLDRFSVASIALANQIVEASAEALARDMTGAPFERRSTRQNQLLTALTKRR